MAIEVTCRCGQRFETPDQYAGCAAQCPACGAALTAPQPRESVPPPGTPGVKSGTEFCNFCHQYIPRGEMTAHREQHLQLQDDGQQTDYATLPEDERASEQELADAPKWYIHTKCSNPDAGATGMPDEIIQTYLANPWFYLADFTYCGGCEKHVPQRKCVGVETGEDLQSYTDRLRAAKPELRPGIFLRIMVWIAKWFR